MQAIYIRIVLQERSGFGRSNPRDLAGKHAQQRSGSQHIAQRADFYDENIPHA
jgi:hypothetical protein